MNIPTAFASPTAFEAALKHDEITMLARFKEGEIGDRSGRRHATSIERVIYRCVIGSQAYGLADAESDVDRRGIYLPPADLHWSLYGVPEQLENHETQEAYWELQKFLVLALKANPNVLECLYTPLVEKATPLAEELLGMKSIFLSRMVYQTYNGYVHVAVQEDAGRPPQPGQVKWKHVMHLIRLLLSGIGVLRDGFVPVAWRRTATGCWRSGAAKCRGTTWRAGGLRLHQEFDAAFETTKLPERPDYERANAFLISARRAGVCGGAAMIPLAAAQETGRTASLSAALRHDQRRAPVRLPVAGFGLRPARRARAAAPGGRRPRDRPGDDRKVGRSRRPRNRPGDARRQEVLRPAAQEERLRAGAGAFAAGRPHDAGARGAEGDRRQCVTRHHAHHYLGFAETQWKLFEKENPPRVKPLLYVYRVLLTGIHLMQTGVVEANLVRLNETAKLPYVDELIQRKVAGAEKERLDRGGSRLPSRRVRPPAESARAVTRGKQVAGSAAW